MSGCAECDMPAQARGLCPAHYARARREHRFETRAPQPLAQRLWSRVERTPSGCWEFIGVRLPNGYGRLRYAAGGHGRTSIGAHTAAWILTNGPIPEGLILRHKCDNPPCCNPEHLELGTKADNSADMVRRGRAASGSRNRASKLTRKQTAEVARLAHEGQLLHRDIARMFGISPSRVTQIKRGL